MTYLQTHSSHNNFGRGNFSRHRGLWGSAATLVIIVIFVQILSPHFLPSIFTTIARPFWRVEFSVSSGSLRSPESLLNENEKLKRQLADMTVRLQTAQSVADENSQLKVLLNRTVSGNSPTAPAATTTTTTAPSPYVLAAVLKRPPLAPYDELIIDIGQNDGVATGNLVYASGNVLIGRVSDTLGQTSKVALFSSPGMTYDILIGDSTTGKPIPAVAHGLGGGQFSVQVPRDVVVNVGDIVTVPSINNKTIGIVGGVITDPAQPFETILFTSLTNIYELRWALVDMNTSSTTSSVIKPSRATTSATKNVKR